MKLRVWSPLAGKVIPVVVAMLMGALALMMIFPMVDESARATTDEDSNSGDSTAEETIAIATTVDEIDLEMTPKVEGGTFTSGSVDVEVTTNDEYGYSLYMGTSGADLEGATTTALINENGPTIPTLSSEATAATFADSEDETTVNQWGYTLDNETYSPLTALGENGDIGSSALIGSSSSAGSGTTTVTFGVKIDIKQAAGNYTNTVTFSAVANLEPAEQTFWTITNMQEMTTEICAAETTPTTDATLYDTDGSHADDTSYIPQITLTDTRDSKTYTVRKLADGNCWMAENLALGTTDSAGLTLTADNSDVTSDWVLPVYDSGTEWENTDSAAHVVQGSTAASSSWTEGMGNWYTFNTATAGTGTDLTSGEASGSICPKGWQLPIGGDSSGWQSTASKSFGYLLKTYGGYYSVLGTITSEPLSFMRAGYYNYQYGKWGIGEMGEYGKYWSNTAVSSTNASSLVASASGIDPKASVERGHGFSVRCVAK